MDDISMSRCRCQMVDISPIHVSQPFPGFVMFVPLVRVMEEVLEGFMDGEGVNKGEVTSTPSSGSRTRRVILRSTTPCCISPDPRHASPCLIILDPQYHPKSSRICQSPARLSFIMTADPYCEHLASPNGWVLALSV